MARKVQAGPEYYCRRPLQRASSECTLQTGPWKLPKIAPSRLPRRNRLTTRAGASGGLRILVQLTVETIADGGLTAEEAAGMIAATRRVALEMFPGKERAFDLIYRPQFQRVMHAVYRLQ